MTVQEACMVQVAGSNPSRVQKSKVLQSPNTCSTGLRGNLKALSDVSLDLSVSDHFILRWDWLQQPCKDQSRSKRWRAGGTSSSRRSAYGGGDASFSGGGLRRFGADSLRSSLISAGFMDDSVSWLHIWCRWTTPTTLTSKSL